MVEKLIEAKDFLNKIGMPLRQQTEICAYALLTLARVHPDDDWSMATNDWIRIHDVLSFTATYYGKVYAENTRETVRKNCMHQFRDGALIEDNGKATNSPNYRYRLTDEALTVVRSISGTSFQDAVDCFTEKHEKLVNKYASKKRMRMMPVRINGQDLHFSPGKHNELQRAILEQFAPRFAPNSECLYVGDTTKKDLIVEKKKLAELGFEITLHEKMPDVVLYRSDKNWLFFVEAVTSVGPMSPKRLLEIKEMTKQATAQMIFVTAFLDFATYKKFSTDLAWETEVWLSEYPDHMIHLNGNKFIGPR